MHIPRGIAMTVALALVGVTFSACTQQLTLNLSPGDCLVLPDSNNIASVTTTACSEAHNAEVVGTSAISAPSLPSPDELESQAQTQCTAAFESYVGVPATASAMELMWLLPTDASWKTGDRAITCLAVSPDKQDITQSLKDSGL